MKATDVVRRFLTAASLGLYGDFEYRGTGLKLSAGRRTGFVDASSPAWRP